MKFCGFFFFVVVVFQKLAMRNVLGTTVDSKVLL